MAVAGREAFGIGGLIVVSIGAAFSTGSAINATLFATARLTYEVAKDGELPAALHHRNRAGLPDRAVIGLGGLAVGCAMLGGLATLVEAASFTFLFTFAIVGGLAFRARAGSRVLTGFGAISAAAALIALVVRLIQTDPVALAFLGLLVLIAVFGRPVLLRHTRTETQPGSTDS